MLTQGDSSRFWIKLSGEGQIKGTDQYQIISNHLGSPVVVINTSTGVVAQQITYDEFGNILTDTAPGFTPFGFAGCLYDIDTKLCRFGARDYDASIGRWLSKDPILFAGGGGASSGQLKHFQRIFDQGGANSLLKSRNSIMNRYNEHVLKIQNATSFTSSMQRENRNFLNELNAIDQIMKKNGCSLE